MKIKASVFVLTKNSEKNLHACLESIKSFDDIIILDGMSSDSTINIAKNYKCRIFRQQQHYLFNNNKIKDFAKARNFCIKETKHDLIFYLDSDEVASKKLIKKIYEISKNKNFNNIAGFLVPRVPANKILNKIEKKLLANYQTRIFFKKKTLKFVKRVHESLIFKKKDFKKFKLLYDEKINTRFEINFDKTKEKLNYYNLIEQNMLNVKFKYFKFSFYRFIFFRLLILFQQLLKIFVLFKKIKNIFIFLLKVKLYEIYLALNLLKFRVRT